MLETKAFLLYQTKNDELIISRNQIIDSNMLVN